MAYSISDIAGTINKNGVLQTNKFLVRFSSPRSISRLSIQGVGSSRATSSERLIQLRAEQARLPGVALTTADINRYGVGPFQKIPYNVQFTDTSITFLADKKAEIYNYFYTWLSSIFDFSGMNSGRLSSSTPSYTADYKENYSTDIEVEIYDNYGNKVSVVKMKQAFPVSMNDIPLNWNQQNELLKITVGFSFRDWSVENVTTTSTVATQPTSTFESYKIQSGAVQTSQSQTAQVSRQLAQR